MALSEHGKKVMRELRSCGLGPNAYTLQRLCIAAFALSVVAVVLGLVAIFGG